MQLVLIYWNTVLFFRFLHEMKRPVLHIIFWLAYSVQDILSQFTFAHRILYDFPVWKQLLMGAETAFILLPTKLFVAYFAMYVFLKSVSSEKKHIISALLWLMLVTATSAILYRVVYCYYTNPVIYGGLDNHPPLFGIMDTWLALMDIVPIAAIAVVIKFVRIQFRSREKERNLMKAKLETELKFLRNQTNPHFLFNTLDSIYALALRKSEDTPEVIMQLAKLLNFMLYESRKAVIGMGEELEILDNYIELESIRFDGKLEIDFIREIDNENEQIAPLLLLSLVDHAFRHADSDRLVESYIHIDIKLQSGVLNVNIETSRDECDQLTPDSNFGLTSIKRQIELLYTDYSLDIEDEKELFKAGLAINLHSYAEI